jgi:hypothetical protein
LILHVATASGDCQQAEKSKEDCQLPIADCRFVMTTNAHNILTI